MVELLRQPFFCNLLETMASVTRLIWQGWRLVARQALCNSARLQGYQLVCPFSVLVLALFPLSPSLAPDILELGKKEGGGIGRVLVGTILRFKVCIFRTAVAYDVHHIPRWMKINKQSLGYWRKQLVRMGRLLNGLAGRPIHVIKMAAPSPVQAYY